MTIVMGRKVDEEGGGGGGGTERLIWNERDREQIEIGLIICIPLNAFL